MNHCFVKTTSEQLKYDEHHTSDENDPQGARVFMIYDSFIEKAYGFVVLGKSSGSNTIAT